LELDQNVGLLLPCNVVVYESNEGGRASSTQVEIADSVAMLEINQNPAMQTLAREARTRQAQVIASLSSLICYRYIALFSQETYETRAERSLEAHQLSSQCVPGLHLQNGAGFVSLYA
jgi:hypothetical protein